MAEIRYIVLVKKGTSGSESMFSGALVASALMIANHPSMLFNWNGDINENQSMVWTTMLMIKIRGGKMSILFGADTGKDFIGMLKRNFADKTKLSVLITSHIYESLEVHRAGSSLSVVGRVAAVIQTNEGGHVVNFTEVKLPYDPSLLVGGPPQLPTPILIPFTHPLLRPPLPNEKVKPK